MIIFIKFLIKYFIDNGEVSLKLLMDTLSSHGLKKDHITGISFDGAISMRNATTLKFSKLASADL